MDDPVYVSRMEAVDEPFSHFDLIIRAEVSTNSQPTSRHSLLYSDLYGIFTIGLMCIRGEPYHMAHYKPEPRWTTESQYTLINSELTDLLDQAMRNYLINHLDADLHNQNEIDLPKAQIIKRTKLEIFVNLMKRMF